MSPNFNHAFISLIPKIKNPEIAKDFRPISLCNMLYKIIAKTIANHFKKLLPKLVSETQSAYMSNRLILDNILVAFETLHHLKSKRRGKSGFMAENSGALNEVSLRSSGPKVSHLFFANDGLLFARANLTDCSTIMDILAIYKLASK